MGLLVSVHAFVDESIRGKLYLISAAIVDPGDLARLRRELRSHLLSGQRELHFKKEKPPRKRQLADRIVGAGVKVRIYTAGCGRSFEIARQACLARLVGELINMGAHRLVLDERAERDKIDAHTLRNALGPKPSIRQLTYEHLDSTSEPLLWIPDAIGWCYGAGNDWRRRISPAVIAVTDCDTQ